MAENSTDGRILHFLVVEDDPDHAEIILNALQEHNAGHTADHISDGAAALKYLESVKSGGRIPDLVLLDLKLPMVDGLDVLDHMKTDTVLRTIPVIVLTTSNAEADRARAYNSHANSYVVKPVSYEKFESLVSELSSYWGGWDTGAPGKAGRY